MPLPIDEQIGKELEHLKLAHRYRSLRIPKSPYTDLSSNDYLSLSVSGKLTRAILNFFPDSNQTRFGATGSRLISGNSEDFERLEVKIADYHNSEAALIFNSGYDANLGLLSSVISRTDTVLYDEYCHASIRDGIQLSKGRSFAFRHNDANDLIKKSSNARGKLFIIVESLYSMDGDLAPLKQLTEVATSLNAALIVDEAHSTGVFGNRGEGYVQDQGLEELVWARIHTFGKALGSHGAAVVGSTELRHFLINRARSFIYTTAMPAFQLLSIDKAYDLLPELNQERARLRALREDFFMLMSESPFEFSHQPTQIQYLLCPGDSQVTLLASLLRERGFEVTPIRAPTVPTGAERIRLCLHAHNTTDELKAFFMTLRDIAETNFPNDCSKITS